MKTKHYLMMAAAVATLTACHQSQSHTVAVVVTNLTDQDAFNVIDGIPLKALQDSLGVSNGTNIRLINELGREVCTQVFDNGTENILLFESNTLANGESIYYASTGQSTLNPDSIQTSVFVKQYPQRKNDLIWENESAIWRASGPETQLQGERIYGYDIWCKNTSEMVADERMLTAIAHWAKADSLRALEQNQRADSISRAGSLYEDHGNGMDCYSVGSNLGGGTAALLNEGSIVYPWAWKTHEILANGPLLAAIRLNYDTLFVGNDTVFEHRTIVTQKGTRFNIINVNYEGLRQGHEIAVGLAYHSDDDSIRLNREGKYIAYSDPTDQPGKNPGRVLIGAYLPTMKRVALEQSHLLGIADYKPGDTFTYYLGSGWSKGDCPSLSAMIKELKQMQEPARTIKIVKK